MLNVVHTPSTSTGRPLVIAHGLYGSARNWGVIARSLSDRGPVMAVDHRNHGQSPWQDTHRYEDLAGDLARIIEANADGAVDLLGHSMGGKAAMMLALTRPDLVSRLIVADIAPVAYAHSQIEYIKTMQAIDLSEQPARAEVQKQLQARLNDAMLASFFSQSYDPAKGAWRLNLDVLARDMPAILGFPDTGASYPGPTLFLSGGLSDYVMPTHRPVMKRLFPAALFLKIPGAGHWLHAEKPAEFTAAVRHWLDR
ncbi:MAG: alpha/beta fold hydrolase [Pseudomonadota bacterium]